MRYKPKDKKTTILIILVAVVAVIFVKSMGFSSTRSATRILYTGKEGRTNWSANYALLDGTMQKTLYTNDGLLSISVETEDGTISIEVKDDTGAVIFDQDGIGTTSFEIEATKKTVVRIEADQHHGSFSISG